MLTTLWHDFPTAPAENAPLRHFARMIWNATIHRQDAQGWGSSVADIRRMWEDASGYFMPLVDSYNEKRAQMNGDDVPITFTRKLWRKVRGPLGATALTAARIGWKFVNPFTVQDHEGAEMLFTNTTPAMVAKRAGEALREVEERRIARRWAADEAVYEDRRACLDLVVSAVKNNKRMTAYQKGVMRSATCGAIMTGAKAVRMGYKTDGMCPLCGLALDTLAHRAYHCPATAQVVEAAVPKWFLQEAHRCAATCRFYTTGICPNPGDLAQRPPIGLDVKVKNLVPQADGDGDDLISLAGRAYIDGSSTTPTIKSMARAACAIVRTTEDGTPLKVLQAAVPRHLPQTAQAAEFLALGLVIRALRGKTEVTGDSLNVVRAANGSCREPFAPSKMYAGILLDTHADPGRRRMAGEVRWTRAHRTIKGGETAEELRDIRGNEAADKEAKEALQEHPPLGRLAESQAEFFEKRIGHVISAMTAALSMFPRASGKMTREERPTDARQARRRRLHLWAFRGGAWRCELCHDWLAGEKLPRARIGQRCTGKTLEDSAKAMTDKGHSICRASASMPIIYCNRCGAWGHKRCPRLSATCSPPTAAGIQALARIRRRQHPLQRRGPKGILLPRETVRTTARFDGTAGAWITIGHVSSATIDCMQDEAHDVPAGVGADAEAANVPGEAIAIDVIHEGGHEEEEDIFGHGGCLDEDDGSRDEAMQQDLRCAGEHEPPHIAWDTAQRVPNEPVKAEAVRSGRRGVKSVRNYDDNGTAAAALHRMMEGSRPAAGDGATRLKELRDRVMHRLARGGPNEHGARTDDSKLEDEEARNVRRRIALSPFRAEGAGTIGHGQEEEAEIDEGIATACSAALAMRDDEHPAQVACGLGPTDWSRRHHPMDDASDSNLDSQEEVHRGSPCHHSARHRSQPRPAAGTSQARLRRHRGSLEGSGSTGRRKGSGSSEVSGATASAISHALKSSACNESPLMPSVRLSDSPNSFALLAEHRGEVIAGLARRGERRDEGNASVVHAAAHVCTGAPAGGAALMDLDDRKRKSVALDLSQAARDIRRRIRGKQPSRPGGSPLTAADGGTTQRAAAAPYSHGPLDAAGNTMGDHSNSLHGAASAAQEIREEHRTRGSGRDPSRFVADLATEQRSSCPVNRYGSKPASCSEPSASQWPTRSWRPPGGAEPAA